MVRSQKTLKHLPFFEALARMTERDPAWRTTSAGLLTLRLVDAWIEEGPSVVAADAWGMRAVRGAIEEVDAGVPARAILLGVVDAMASARGVEMAVVAPRLMAYGRALDFEGSWQLAIDVYQTVVAHVHPLEDADLAIDGHMRVGYCGRMLGDLDVAASGYGTAGQIAETVGDLMGVLRARIGDAKLALARGNMPQAEAILGETIDRAGAGGFGEVRAIALHDLSTVASMRGDYERAIRLAYDALGGITSPSARDRVLADIAGSFLDLGVRSAARDAYVILAATAEEQYSRWASTLNLLEIAALDRCEPVFEQYRQELAEASLPPALAATYHLEVGRGYHIFHDADRARRALERAVEIATTHQLNRVLFLAEESLRDVQRDERRSMRPPAAEVPGVEDVAAAIRSMRETAGV